MRKPWWTFAVLPLLVGSACGDGGTARGPSLGPTPPVSPPVVAGPAPVDAVITVTDGWTGEPVAGVRVESGTFAGTTDGVGRIEVPLACRPATFVAPGYLERQVRCLLGITLSASLPITLWPAANDAERQALRQAFFGFGDRLSLATGESGNVVGFADDLPDRPTTEQVFRTAAARIRDLTGGRVIVPFAFPAPGGDGYVIAATATPSCGHPWFSWRFAVARFCWDFTADYFVQKVLVDEARLTTPEVPLRALLYGWGMRQHDAPGLLNASAPAPDLSEFERRGLHMASLRRAIVWPDDER